MAPSWAARYFMTTTSATNLYYAMRHGYSVVVVMWPILVNRWGVAPSSVGLQDVGRVALPLGTLNLAMPCRVPDNICSDLSWSFAR